MSFLHSVTTKDFEDTRYPFYAKSFNGHDNGYDIASFSFIKKIVFTSSVKVLRDPDERRYVKNISENEWLKYKILDNFILEDSLGKKYSLDYIFLDKHDFPVGLSTGTVLNIPFSETINFFQKKGYSLIIKMDSCLKKIKLINPIIIKVEKNSLSENPYTHFGDKMPQRYRGISLMECFEVYFEMLCDSYEEVPFYSLETIKKILSKTLKNNLLPCIRYRHVPFYKKIDDPEKKALNTLRDLLSEKDFKKYLINGFIMVRGNSGKFYQIFKNQKHIRVYEKGILIKELCIHTDAKEVPPTDHVLNIKVMIECDELSLWNNSNNYDPKVIKETIKKPKEENINVVQLYRNLKSNPRTVENLVNSYGIGVN